MIDRARPAAQPSRGIFPCVVAPTCHGVASVLPHIAEMPGKIPRFPETDVDLSSEDPQNQTARETLSSSPVRIGQSSDLVAQSVRRPLRRSEIMATCTDRTPRAYSPPSTRD